MKINEVVNFLETLAPPFLQEGYDNAGLITGNSSCECTGALTTLDCIPQTIDEAIRTNCNLVIAHHPIIFKGLKKITGKNYVEETIIKAIKNDIAIYAIHTNLDNVLNGVNDVIARKLNLENKKILSPKSGILQKLAVHVPETHKDELANALYNAGAGSIGKYRECSFQISGIGTFKPGEGSNPFSGAKGIRQTEPETKLELVFPKWKQREILNSMWKNHPYEEVAYDIFDIINDISDYGSGVIGELINPLSEIDFLKFVKDQFKLNVIKHTSLLGRNIKKVAVCGGAGFFLLNNAISAGADVFITSDVKYHEYFDASGIILLADIGHYESEQFTIEFLYDKLRENFPNFAVLKTAVVTNPVHYFT
ncbi:MAG: Nif3-like dinuclear metal center hexameric protein [Ferruginibacter sp.]